MIDYAQVKIFIDFDGTITKTDVGQEMFLRFGNPVKAQEIIDEREALKISAIETWQQLCKTVNKFDAAAFERMLDEIEFDGFFNEFIKYCEDLGIKITVLSDGLDYYINKLLKRENLEQLPVYCNKLEIGSAGEIIPVFPYTDEECRWCANCKRNHIIANSSDDDFTIYIGDGTSDVCPAQFCDYIFAKSSLLKFCEKNRISYFPYTTFRDVKILMEKLLSKKRLKKRNSAILKRREVYLQG